MAGFLPRYVHVREPPLRFPVTGSERCPCVRGHVASDSFSSLLVLFVTVVPVSYPRHHSPGTCSHRAMNERARTVSHEMIAASAVIGISGLLGQGNA